MFRKSLSLLSSIAAAVLMVFISMAPVQAQTQGGGPYGDIDGYYTWEINGKGWTIYSQNGYSWVYDDYGNRTYLDAGGNKLPGVNLAAAKTIAQMKLTYYTTSNGVYVYSNPDGKLYTVDSNGYLYNYGTAPTPTPTPTPAGPNDLVVTYVFTSAEGLDIFKDVNGNLWYFGDGYFPYMYWGTSAGSYWRSGVSNRVFRYQFVDSGHTIYSDSAGRLWYFEKNAAHAYHNGGGFNPQPTPTPSGKTNTMYVDGKQSTVSVGQYWQAPSYASWAPDGMRLIGWDYAENTGYARWKPGAYIQNTGSDLYLYPVYG
jgi:hypothetical protein